MTLCDILQPLLVAASILAVFVTLAEITSPVRINRKLYKYWLSDALVRSKKRHWTATIYFVTLPLIYAFLLPLVFPFRALGLAAITALAILNLCK